MDYKFLGETGVRVSALSLGTATFGAGTRGIGGVDAALADRMIGLSAERGVNLLDVADSYSGGESEALLGQVLGHRRDKMLIATKCGKRLSDDVNAIGATRWHIVRACEASLRRLNTDRIDLYQLHAFDAYTAIDETLRAFEDLIRAGKVLHVGASNFSAWQLMKALGVADQRGLPRFAAHQLYYSLAGRDVEHELVPLALDQQVGLIVWGALAFGTLAGRFRRGETPPEGARAAMMLRPGGRDATLVAGLTGAGAGGLDRLYDLVDAAQAIAAARGVGVAQVALNYVRAKPGVTSVLIGARTEAQLVENLAAADWTLAPQELAELDRISAQPAPFPYWHQQHSNPERNPPTPPYRGRAD